MTVHYILTADSLIDIKMEEIRNAKVITNLEIIGPLRRKDDKALKIPIIIPYLSFDYLIEQN